MSSDLIEKARLLASERHAKLRRPNRARLPLIEHLAEVAELSEKAGASSVAIAAAWLHDIIEDTPTTLEEIRGLFGDEIAGLVDALTDPEHFAALPLGERKRFQAERLRQKDRQVLLVKLADQISNVRSIAVDPPLDWDEKKSLTYALGAKQIAEVCAGQSAFLDAQFAEAFARVELKWA